MSRGVVVVEVLVVEVIVTVVNVLIICRRYSALVAYYDMHIHIYTYN